MGSEQLRKRLDNQSAILEALHFEGPLRRGELSSRLHIRKSSVTSIVTGLLGVGIVTEVEPGHMRSPLQLDRERFFAVVAGLTPREVRLARVNLGGKMQLLDEIPIVPGAPPSDTLNEIGTRFSSLAEAHPNELLGFGVAMPGHIDPTEGLCRKATNLKSWEMAKVVDLIQRHLGNDTRGVLLENDVRSQLWGGNWFDRVAKERFRDVIYLAIHDGVACSILSGGQLVVGRHCAAGEIGSIRVGDEGRIWANGVTDCLEAYASMPAILNAVREVLPKAKLMSAADVAAAARGNDEVKEALKGPVEKIALVLAGFVAALDPDTVLLGTPDREFSELLRPLLQDQLFSELIGDVRETEILIAAPVEEGAIRGIAGRVIQHGFRHAPILRDTRVQEDSKT